MRTRRAARFAPTPGLRWGCLLAVVAAALCATCGAAIADAATLSPEYPCYADDESVVVTGSGFTPYGEVILSASGQQLGTVEADYLGEIDAELFLPPLSPLLRLRVLATERADLSVVASTVVRIAATDVLLTPATGPPNRIRRILAWGFIDSGPLYVHVKRHGAGRARTIRLGWPRGACGTLDVTRRLFPRSPQSGLYTVKFDTRPRYLRGGRPSVVYSLAVGRR